MYSSIPTIRSESDGSRIRDDFLDNLPLFSRHIKIRNPLDAYSKPSSLNASAVDKDNPGPRPPK
jgi:hypothetical protein